MEGTDSLDIEALSKMINVLTKVHEETIARRKGGETIAKQEAVLNHLKQMLEARKSRPAENE
jgi:hypothetical protein